MTRVQFATAARLDRREIMAYTVERFGIPQGRRLRTKLEHEINLLVVAPGLGRPRPDLDPPGHDFLYALVARRFICVYEPSADGIRVARLLHGMRRIARELRTDDGASDD